MKWEIYFNPRTPCGVRRSSRRPAARGRRNFNPRTPCGVRHAGLNITSRGGWYFNPRTPCGVRRAWPSPRDPTKHHFNPRTPCGVRRFRFPQPTIVSCISIHAPLAGCDHIFFASRLKLIDFNPRTPCGVRHCLDAICYNRFGFQSTHPLRGATFAGSAGSAGHNNFNPRTPCWVRLAYIDTEYDIFDFNPRTPCGVRLQASPGPMTTAIFQSTHPLRGATLTDWICVTPMPISIHAPLAGCDCANSADDKGHDISIHAPLAGCDGCRAAPIPGTHVFQSTHPLRGATASLMASVRLGRHFNPRTPCGVRPFPPEDP